MTRIDAQQLQQLVATHGPALTLYARQWCRAPEDALQEALIDLLRQTQTPDQPVAWLYKTVRRRAMNLARSEQRRAERQQEASRQRPSWFLPSDDATHEPIDMQTTLARLPRLEREIVVARIWGELSFDQIAELVERSTSSVHRRYQRTLVKLRHIMNLVHDSSEACR